MLEVKYPSREDRESDSDRIRIEIFVDRDSYGRVIPALHVLEEAEAQGKILTEVGVVTPIALSSKAKGSGNMGVGGNQ